jgi:CspA family cold shock protein
VAAPLRHRAALAGEGPLKPYWVENGGGKWEPLPSRLPGHQLSPDATVTPTAEVARKKISSVAKQRLGIYLPLDFSFSRRKGMAASMNGTIKRLVSDKGFGFILADDGNEYFFHNSACRDTRFDQLREGQSVTFEKGQGPKGPRAESVRVA